MFIRSLLIIAIITMVTISSVSGQTWGCNNGCLGDTFYTPVGSNVVMQLTDSMYVTFDSIEVSGMTFFYIDTASFCTTGEYFLIPQNPCLWYIIEFGGIVYKGQIKVCITYSENEVTFNESGVDLMRCSWNSFFEACFWSSSTESRDTVSNVVCGDIWPDWPNHFIWFLAQRDPCVIPGDANASGTYTLGDVMSIVNYIFSKPGCTPLPLCWLSGLLCRGDWNGSETVALDDVIRAVNYLFNKPGGPWKPVPSGVCCLPVP